ncbi:MAG: hypothetical protein Q8N03_12020 [Ignavibacteria bacterium]|nr:hypothetical protein [Ignavibacteria bacterium]
MKMKFFGMLLILSNLLFVNIIANGNSEINNQLIADSSTTTVIDGITAEDIFAKYLSAIGGKEVLLKVIDRTTLMSATFQDFNIDITVYQKAPNKYLQSTSFSGQETFMVYDGTKGYQQSFMGSGDIVGDELEMLKIEASLHFLANWMEFGVKLELAGTQKINDKDAYEVKMILPSGTTITQSFDAENYLKIRETKSISSPQGTIDVTIDYSDYRDVEGVKYPFKLTQAAGGMKLDFDVTGIMVNKGIADEIFNKK